VVLNFDIADFLPYREEVGVTREMPFATGEATVHAGGLDGGVASPVL
jgi:hypothetical protein